MRASTHHKSDIFHTISIWLMVVLISLISWMQCRYSIYQISDHQQSNAKILPLQSSAQDLFLSRGSEQVRPQLLILIIGLLAATYTAITTIASPAAKLIISATRRISRPTLHSLGVLLTT